MNCYVVVPNLELAKAVGNILVDKNIYPKSLSGERIISKWIDDIFGVITNNRKFALSFQKNFTGKFKNYGYCGADWYESNGYNRCSIEEILDLPVVKKPLKIAGLDVELINGDKVQVGCTQVTLQEVKDLLALMKDKGSK